MKIGIDASSLIQRKTGIGSFASFLIEEMTREPEGLEFQCYSPKSSDDLNTPARLWWESVQLPRMAKKNKVDVLYSPGFSPPPCGKFKKFVTVHDLIGLIYPANTGPISSFYWSSWLPANLKKADYLIASSESTRRDMERLLDLPTERVSVVRLAVRPHFCRVEDSARIQTTLDRYQLKRPFFISVSTLEPRKNLLRLCQAYEKLIQKNRDFSMVIVGKPGAAEATLTHFIKEKGLGGRIRRLGYLQDEELVNLYNAAYAYVTVSLYEGFGLPALEAMSSGLTGIVSNNSSLPEVTGNTALLVDPQNVEMIADAMLELAGNESQKKQLAEAAFTRSKQFSIQKTAGQMKQIFKKG